MYKCPKCNSTGTFTWESIYKERINNDGSLIDMEFSECYGHDMTCNHCHYTGDIFEFETDDSEYFEEIKS